MRRFPISSGECRTSRFEVTDLSSELAGREILIPANNLSDGVRVAFIVEKRRKHRNWSNLPTPNIQPVYRTKWTSNGQSGS
jgi:hypothetical protein